MNEFRFKVPEGTIDNPFTLRVGHNGLGSVFEYDSINGGLTTDGNPIEPGKFYSVKFKKTDTGRFEKTVEEAPPAPDPIGPMFLCPFHGFEQFESGPCPDCYDEQDE